MTVGQGVPPLSDAEEAEIQRRIAADPDAPEADEAALAKALPFAEVFPDLAAGIRRDAARDRVSVSLDPDVVEKFRATGPGWERRINEVLKRAKV